MIQVILQFATLHAAVRVLSEIPADLLVGEKTLTLVDAPIPATADGTIVETAAAPVEKPKRTPAATPAAPAPSPRTAEVAAATAAPEKTAAESSPTAAPAVAEPQASTAVPERSTVSKAAVALALKDKPRIIEILASFGAKAAKELTDAQLAPALAAINTALEG